MTKMSNSPLVSYTKLAKYRYPRKHKIDTITVHCTAGQCDVEPLGEMWWTKAASSNYGIGRDGRIGLYVPENERSVCSSNVSNDDRAITIEVASDAKEPCNVNPAAYSALINLLVDICKRNGIPKLLWRADKLLIGQVDKQNMTVHRWFHSGKSCPGTYLYERMGKIADDVNKRLCTAENQPKNVIYRVQVGAFSNRLYADSYLRKAKRAGFEGFVIKGADKLYRVQIGAFSSLENANSYLAKAREEHFEGFVVKADVPEPKKPEITVGSSVRVKSGAKTYNGGNLASFVFNRTHTVKEIKNDRAVITYAGAIVAAVNVKDLEIC